MKNLLLGAFLLCQSILFAQEIDLSVAAIPDDLKENANSVMRLDALDMEIHSSNRLTYTVRVITTVLNKKGLRDVPTSVGYNPNNDTYIEDADGMDNADFENIYKKWIKEQFVEKKETEPRYEGNAKRLLAAAEEAAETQWDGIVTSLTNDQKEKIYGPIEWIRIHNLPDHAYFNHAQHVTVGNLKCQNCHGPVEEMELVYQYSPLSMGWCVNCHRQTEVQFDNNDYYKAYERYHEELKNGERDGVRKEEQQDKC